MSSTETPPTDSTPDPISAELERALFLRFWRWLAIVGSVVVVVVSGFSVIASQAMNTALSGKIEEATKQISTLQSHAIDNINQIQLLSVNAAILAGQSQVKSAAIAETALAQATNLQKNIDLLPDLKTMLKDTDSIVSSFLSKKEFIDLVDLSVKN